ncbi:hypothetical protein HPP92_011011 [Vanilla planifolia]|uniref:Uncharacterized protein n=1 Tax=Vanilla planifolia TaxID=51239 RepID=A0A835RAL0_VANPL|nr:hypothetical protein HPP92_011011 [Vanilla planifolia]
MHDRRNPCFIDTFRCHKSCHPITGTSSTMPLLRSFGSAPSRTHSHTRLQQQSICTTSSTLTYRTFTPGCSLSMVSLAFHASLNNSSGQDDLPRQEGPPQDEQ